MRQAPGVAQAAVLAPASILPIEMSSSGIPAAGESRVLGRPARYRPALLLGLLAVLMVGSIVGLWALRDNDTADEVNVRVHDVSDRAGAKEQPLCGDVHVAGVITADGPTSITYQWKVDGELVAPSRSHAFEGPGKMVVDGPGSYPSGDTGRAEDDGTVTRTYELVVARNDRDEWRAHDIEIECLVARS
jgi:hypothetical protein